MRAQWQHWHEQGSQLAAPSLIHYETTNALYQYRRRGILSEETFRLAQEAALALPITIYGDKIGRAHV